MTLRSIGAHAEKHRNREGEKREKESASEKREIETGDLHFHSAPYEWVCAGTGHRYNLDGWLDALDPTWELHSTSLLEDAVEEPHPGARADAAGAPRERDGSRPRGEWHSRGKDLARSEGGRNTWDVSDDEELAALVSRYG